MTTADDVSDLVEYKRLRDQFAAAALCSLVSFGGWSKEPTEVAARTYEIADAMMEERARHG